MVTWPKTLSRIRPFAEAPASLLILLVVIWEVVACNQPCHSNSYYLELFALTVTVCIALWVNHVAAVARQQPVDWTKIVGRSIYDLFALGALLMLTGIPWLVNLPTYSCDNERSRASEVYFSASSLKETVASRALARGALAGSGTGLVFPPSGRVKSRVITDNGIIISASDDPVVVFILTPSLRANEVQWKCTGYPAKFVPAFCRAE